jgi:hypothetical protein
MCVPVAALAIGSLVATAVGGAASAYGAIETGKAQAASYTYQSQLARQNAQVAAGNAASAQIAGDKAQTTQQQRVAQIAGRQRADMGANNIDLTSGSAASVQQDTQTLGQADVENIRSSYYDRIRGDVAQQNSFTGQSQMDLASASNAKTAGYMGAATSLLGTASSVGSKWSGYQQQGVFG